MKVFRLYSLLILISTSFAACSERPENTDALPAADSTLMEDTTEQVELPPREFPLLNQENHEEFLLNYFEENPERIVELETYLGKIKIRLYEETPLHTANFLMLVKRDYFNNTEFTRVVKNFVVQGGNNDKEEEEIKRLLIGNYEMKPEFREDLLHKKGALAMARRYEENPEKKSSAYNFYLVHGQKFSTPQLLAIERDHEMTIPEWKKDVYRNLGGAPHLDMEHTVFGEITEGMDVLDKMANVKTDGSEWPAKPMIMKISIVNE